MVFVICGIDEAGRGPVIGPLVVAGVQVDDEKALEGIGVKDSKKCTPERRERLAEMIKSRAKAINLVVLHPEEIDNLRSRMTLNEIEVEAFCKVMKSLKSDVYYVDSADVNEDRFAKELEKRIDFDAKIISSHKAEEKFLVVASASIIAKTTRDRLVREIEKELRAAVRKAVAKNKRGGAEPKPLVARKPVKIKVVFQASQFADVAELLPTVKRVNGLEVEYVSRNMTDAYKTFELLTLAAAGVTSILERLT